jgi:hypothetical protein
MLAYLGFGTDPTAEKVLRLVVRVTVINARELASENHGCGCLVSCCAPTKWIDPEGKPSNQLAHVLEAKVIHSPEYIYHSTPVNVLLVDIAIGGVEMCGRQRTWRIATHAHTTFMAKPPNVHPPH